MLRNNRNKIHGLMHSYSRANKKKNNILTGTYILLVFVIFISFSIAKGKIEADTLKNIRQSGTTANACLKNGTLDQLNIIQSLNYVEKVGKEKVFAHCFEGKVIENVCVVLDKTEWLEIRKPACRRVIGKYPTKENEIMVSQRFLKKRKITDPKIGMKIQLTIVYDDWDINGGEEQTQTFVLSGYYSDYVKETEGGDSIYFADKHISKKGITWDRSNLYINLKENVQSGTVLETKLYSDLEVQSEQQIVVTDSASYKAVEQFIGGYVMAFICGTIILISAYMVIHNVLYISMNKDIRQYGLLTTIGATSKQIQGIIRYQFRGIWIKGTLGSIALCCTMGGIGLPFLLKKLYLEGNGELSIKQVFSLKIMIISIVFASITFFITNEKSGKVLKKMSPIESFRYTESNYNTNINKSKRQKFSRKGISIYQMAKRNVCRSRKKYWLTIISLFLGCEVSIVSIFIGTGADITNKLTENPDFIIGTSQKAIKNYLFEDSSDILTKELFENDFLLTIKQLPEIEQKSIKTIDGCYSSINYGQDAALGPREDANVDIKNKNTAATIQIVDERELNNLEKYVKSSNLNITLDTVRDGTGTLVLHKHELSQEQEKSATKFLGQPIHFSKSEENVEEIQMVEFKNSGYLDVAVKNFPEINTSWIGDGINYFLVSKKGILRMGGLKQTYQIRFDAKEGKETELKKLLTELVSDENQRKNETIYYLTSNSDVLKSADEYIVASKIIMWTLSAILLFMGLMNYTNTIITSHYSRQKEFATMYSLGMTSKQLKKMLICEGGYYALSVWLAISIVGNLILCLLYFIIKKQITYFKFIYPLKCYLLIIIGLLIICTVIPKVLCRQDTGTSTVEKLKQND